MIYSKKSSVSFTLHSGQMGTPITLGILDYLPKFTLHSGQMGTELKEALLLLNQCSHSTQVRWELWNIYPAETLKYAFTLHSGQMGTQPIDPPCPQMNFVHTPLRSDGNHRRRSGCCTASKFTLHSGQMGTQMVRCFNHPHAVFTLHSGQMGT